MFVMGHVAPFFAVARSVSPSQADLNGLWHLRDAIDREWHGFAGALGASQASFLVVVFSGRALIPLGHADVEAAAPTQGREPAERVPLVGSPHGRALRRQTDAVEAAGPEARVFAPVTNRGEAIGVLELKDDATAMGLDGQGGPPRERTTDSGANQSNAL